MGERRGFVLGGFWQLPVQRRVDRQRLGDRDAVVGGAQGGGRGEVATRTGTADADAFRVAAQLTGVLDGPPQCRHHVVQRHGGVHAGLPLGVRGGLRIGPGGGLVDETVEDGDDDGVGPAGDAAGHVVGLGHVQVAVHERAAVDPHQHGSPTVRHQALGGVDPHRHTAVGAGQVAVLDHQVPALGGAVVGGPLLEGAGGGVGEGGEVLHQRQTLGDLGAEAGGGAAHGGGAAVLGGVDGHLAILPALPCRIIAARSRPS